MVDPLLILAARASALRYKQANLLTPALIGAGGVGLGGLGMLAYRALKQSKPPATPGPPGAPLPPPKPTPRPTLRRRFQDWLSGRAKDTAGTAARNFDNRYYSGLPEAQA